MGKASSNPKDFGTRKANEVLASEREEQAEKTNFCLTSGEFLLLFLMEE